MKIIQKIGLIIFLMGLAVFTAVPLLGTFKLDQNSFDSIVAEKNIKTNILYTAPI